MRIIIILLQIISCIHTRVSYSSCRQKWLYFNTKSLHKIFNFYKRKTLTNDNVTTDTICIQFADTIISVTSLQFLNRDANIRNRLIFRSIRPFLKPFFCILYNCFYEVLIFINTIFPSGIFAWFLRLIYKIIKHDLFIDL